MDNDSVEQRNLSESDVLKTGSSDFRIPLIALCPLFLTAGISLVWSHYRLLFRDEYWEMWTDRVSSLRQVIDIQLTNPVALDPLFFHAVAHTFIRMLGANSFALRLPALLSVLLMQLCLFVFVRRISTEYTAVFAMSFPALTSVMGYSMEGRPYAMLLASFGIAMVCWQTAAHREKERTLALVTLAISLAVAVNTQYFGILLLAPLWIAESFRIYKRKRIDLPIIVSILVGSLGIICAVPFMKAAKGFKTSYEPGSPSLKSIPWSYIWTLGMHTGTKADRFVFAAVATIVCISLWGFWRYSLRKGFASCQPDEVYLVGLAILPFFGYAAAVVTSPALEPRFVVPVVIGLSAITALGLFSLGSGGRYEKGLLIGLFFGIGLSGIVHIFGERKAAAQMMNSARLQPQVTAALFSDPNQKLYVEDLETFAFLSFYECNPNVLQRIALVYSRNQEQKWNHESVIALSALHLHNFAGVPIITYEQVELLPGTHLFVDFSKPLLRAAKPRHWNWIGLALEADHANSHLVGVNFLNKEGVTGNVVSASFPP